WGGGGRGRPRGGGGGPSARRRREILGDPWGLAVRGPGARRPPPPVRILLPGGGAELPFVRGLAAPPEQVRVPVIEENPPPPWVAGTNWNVAFRQLAVAVGGAMPSLPEQK